MGVDLSTGYSSVPCDFLNGGHRSPGGGQPGQARVTESVRRGPEIQIRDLTISLDDLLDGPDGQRPVLSMLKQWSCRSNREPTIPIELDQFFDARPSGSI